MSADLQSNVQTGTVSCAFAFCQATQQASSRVIVCNLFVRNHPQKTVSPLKKKPEIKYSAKEKKMCTLFWLKSCLFERKHVRYSLLKP